MTLLTQATDVFGSREFATVGGLDPGAGRAWGIVALREWNDAWCATSAEAPP